MYSHLNKEQRLELGFLLREGYSLRRLVCRNASA